MSDPFDDALAEAVAETKQAMAIVRAAQPLFEGKPATVQGTALADLLALWLAGHVIPGNPDATKRAREQVLEKHLVTVRALIDINYTRFVEPRVKRNMQ